MIVFKLAPFFINRWAYSVVSIVVFFILVRFVSLEGWGWLSLGLIIYIFFEQIVIDVVEPAVFKFNLTAKELYALFKRFIIFSVMLSVVVSVCLFFFYNSYELLWVGLSFSMIIPIQIKSAIIRNMALKSKDFKRVNISVFSATIVSSATSFTAVTMGADYFSFIIHYLMFNFVSYLFVATWYVDFVSNNTGEHCSQEFNDFVKKNALSTFVNIFSNRLDIMFIGAVLNGSAAGVVNLCKRLVQVVQDLLGSSIDKFAMSLKSNIGHNVHTGFYVSNLQMKLLIPVFACGYFYSNNIVYYFLGQKWGDVIIYLPLFCIGGLFRAISNIEKNNLVMSGKSDKVLFCRWIDLVVTVTGLISICFYGNDIVFLVAILFCVKYAFIYFLFIYFYSDKFFRDVLVRITSVLCSSFLCWLVFFVFSKLLSFKDGFLSFVISIFLFFVCCYMLMLILFKIENLVYEK